MSIENPFQSPTPEEEIVLPAGPTLRIEPLQVPWQGFECKVLSSEEVCQRLHAKIVEHCQELGFQITEGEAEYTLEGSLMVVTEGNRVLRYLTHGLVGHVKVEAAGEISGGPDQSKAYVLKTSRGGGGLGFKGIFGGHTESMLGDCISELGYKISTEAGLAGRRIDPQQSASAWAYLRVLLGFAAIVGAVLGVARYGFGTTGVALTDDMIYDEVRNAIFTALPVFAVISLLGLAFAPQWVLLSRTLYKLRASAGIKSIWGLRLMLATFALLAAGLAALMSIKLLG